MTIDKEKTDWGMVWNINGENKSFRFSVYVYDDDNSTLYLSNVFVSKEHRGKGLGNKILETADKIAEKFGCKQICLKAKIGSNAYSWYKRHGYNDLEKDNEDNDYMWLIK